MEAGVSTLLRVQPGQLDAVLVVAEPTAKSLDVARRAAAIASKRSTALVVANKIRDESDLQAVRAALPSYDLFVVPDEQAIVDAERDGVAPIDVGAHTAGVRSLVELAERLAVLGENGGGDLPAER